MRDKVSQKLVFASCHTACEPIGVEGRINGPKLGSRSKRVHGTPRQRDENSGESVKLALNAWSSRLLIAELCRSATRSASPPERNKLAGLARIVRAKHGRLDGERQLHRAARRRVDGRALRRRGHGGGRHVGSAVAAAGVAARVRTPLLLARRSDGLARAGSSRKKGMTAVVSAGGLEFARTPVHARKT